ncbi:trypsin-like peptidase domain-containing protein [Carboxylicivirga taeanensis]|uniref:trypsin-like peptidase domain-containing protein n=1 Tax=Carboxylicivirga taeanensis TaxID=1416875 RepID=UPI003F6DD78B
MTTTKLKILLLLVACPTLLFSQSKMDIINNSEKAVFDVRTYNSNKQLTASASGFFISSDGLAITMGQVFEKADSAVITLRGGKKVEIERILSVHPNSNMVLIKVKPTRQKTFSYLIPAKQSFTNNEELLIFTHPLESPDGMTLAPVKNLSYFHYISRVGIIDGPFTSLSAGAPAISDKGLLCGILNVSDNGSHKILYSSHLLNDSNWVNINRPFRNTWRPTIQPLFNSLLSQSLLNISCHEYVEAAKNLSQHIKTHPRDYKAHCLRAYARFKYENLTGSRADFELCQELNPNGFLHPYYQGLFQLTEQKNSEARNSFETCLDRKLNFAPAIIQLARLNYESNKAAQTAFEWYSAAIEADSLLAEGYYERALLRMKHSSSMDGTLNDIDKAIYLNPDLPGLFSIRGAIHFKEKDYLPAISDLDLAIEKDPTDVHAWFTRGMAHYNIGMHEKACYDWDKAGRLGNYEAFTYLSRYCKGVKLDSYDR